MVGQSLKNKNPVFRGIMELVDFFAASWGLVGQRVVLSWDKCCFEQCFLSSSRERSADF
jgi:hypothetical protein